MNWAVIMAGGSGTRFWPLSNTEHPKQFLRLLGERTPALSCITRLNRIVDMDHILIVASEKHRKVLAEALPDFPLEQVLWEPIGRNTAPCIAWATETIRQRDPDAKIGVFPSDHEISDETAFSVCLRKAYDFSKNRIVLFGIEPTRPETGYGYIEQGSALETSIYCVSSFREKPDAETAAQYLKEGRFLWNSGMFIYDAQTMHSELTRCVPQIMSIVDEMVKNPACVPSRFGDLMSISIDYAVMEHTDKAAVIRASFPWDDLGTWDSVRRYYPADDRGNASRGPVRRVDCTNTFTYSDDGRIIAVIGLENVVVVSTADAVLVMDGTRSQDVRKVVKD